MARNDLGKLIKDLDRVAATTAVNAPRRAAERIVRDLQERGPAWSGSFSNSWQIEGPDRLVRGNGEEGKAKPLVSPRISSIRTLLTKNKLLFKISNFSPYADVATDIAPGNFINPGTDPIKPVEKTGQRTQGIRGLLAGTGGNRRTAPVFWFTRYVRGGFVDKTVKTVMRGLTP